ncbi:BAR adaptor protein Hob3 [Elasticomyces elasticus]|uniref:BAR adaptor protein Hob3 n=1 Tax=Exophiala sideris TaxID=1016849 RepID=A0ABR0JEZ4_9EURO|nr:BAR adaptor protein Hob3 [Elasticomyces elasticus]KAK5032774.1 BAR adaptor protein Hob3 [Exophiala sideris]KAK5037045.1 BAR adaptor protein Hob3 [Exophiala sideris]KAK5062298.1 BAR adaptor protein Hob3 [Exophiala sideris]KAK5182203.1 BAR adaptor protein Hob3 [Eurotiomycetes sp. CCFEE 6388]
MEAQCLAKVKAHWLRRLHRVFYQPYRPYDTRLLNVLAIIFDVVNAGPVVNEDVHAFNARITHYYQLWVRERDVVGRLQEECQPGNDPGHVERTNDRDYEVEERRFRTMESAANRLQKEAKGYLDSLRGENQLRTTPDFEPELTASQAMTASQMRIAETIDAFYGDAGTRDGVSRSYKQAVEDLDAETIKALDGPYRTTVLEPISRFCAYFPDINECIKKRNNKLLDYDSMRSKVKKLVEKPDKDVTKLPRAEKEAEMAKQAYEQLNEQLFTELPQLIDLRVPYLDPSFEALVKIQLRFCAEAYSRMAQVQQYLDPDTRDQYARGDLDNRVEQVLSEIRDLTIAGTV